MVPPRGGLNGNAAGAGETSPKPQLPPQLYVVSRTPIKPLEKALPDGGIPGRRREASIHKPGNRPADQF
jgi:hypothetical protein